MKSASFGVLAACVLLPLLPCGCATKSIEVAGEAQNSRHLVTSSQDEQVALGIIRQRTIYPAHFLPGTADLNGLGERDLTVLASYFERHPGELSVWRAGAPQALYDARVRAVRTFLERHGVQVARMNFSETWPGGEGLGAESAGLRYLSSEPLAGKAAGPTGGGEPAPLLGGR